MSKQNRKPDIKEKEATIANNLYTLEHSFSAGVSGRHETFTPRYGWLKKGYDRCIANPHVFNDDNAIEQLGVGKNMVRSIRFWCILFRLLEDAGKPGCLQPSEFGHRLLDSEDGWDPYLEDPASLWLLHWQIFKPPFIAVSWNIAFTFTALPSFTAHELADFIHGKAGELGSAKHIARGSFERDASCILRMYATEGRERAEIRCPFADLKLIISAKEESSSGRFRFETGLKRTLPDWMFMAAVFDYAALWFPGQKSLSLNQIAYGPNSPGIAFRLSETDCGHRLEGACRRLEKSIFTETDGVRQVQFRDEPGSLSLECTERHYGEAR